MKVIIQQIKKLEKQASKCKKTKLSTHANNQEQSRLDNMKQDIKAIKKVLEKTTKS